MKEHIANQTWVAVICSVGYPGTSQALTDSCLRSFLHIVYWISPPSPMVTQRNDLLCVASPLTNETENLEVAFKRVPVHSQEIICLSYFLSSLSRRLGD